MGRWIAALKKCENASETNRQNRQNPAEEGFVGFGGALSTPIAEFFSAHAHTIFDSLGGHSSISPEAFDRWVEFEERAAILEYDGGFSREEAERLARQQVYGRSDRSP